MAMMNTDSTWKSVTLAADEGWQCRAGQLLVTKEAAGDEDRGILLNHGQAWSFTAGDTVYFRAVFGTARVAREAI